MRRHDPSLKPTPHDDAWSFFARFLSAIDYQSATLRNDGDDVDADTRDPVGEWCTCRMLGRVWSCLTEVAIADWVHSVPSTCIWDICAFP